MKKPGRYDGGGKIRCCENCVEPKRHIGCHSTCEEYKQEKLKNDLAREKEREQKQKIGCTVKKYEFDTVIKMRKSRAKKKSNII